MSGWPSLGEGLVGCISLGEKRTTSRHEAPETGVCGCVRVNASVYLYWRAHGFTVCVHTPVAHSIRGYGNLLQWKDPWAGTQKISILVLKSSFPGFLIFTG